MAINELIHNRIVRSNTTICTQNYLCHMTYGEHFTLSKIPYSELGTKYGRTFTPVVNPEPNLTVPLAMIFEFDSWL